VAAHRRNTEIFVDLMAALPEALLVVDGEGCPIFLNALAEQLIARHDGLALTHGRLVAASPTEAGELRKLIGEAAAWAGGSAGRRAAEIAITRPSGGPSLVLRIAPMPHPAMDHVGREKLVVAILVHWAEPAEAVGRFCHAHRLTPAEGRLAALILNGHSLLDAAAELHITKNTARTHMKRIYAKTETHRQTDLIRLVADGSLHFH
jgi:DNA-binding CsgD family transcriptional regulator